MNIITITRVIIIIIITMTITIVMMPLLTSSAGSWPPFQHDGVVGPPKRPQ